MKTILLSFLAGSCLIAQTAVTGPLLDSTGTPANCQLSIQAVRVAGVSPTVVGYAVVGGDLSGASGGYGQSSSTIERAAALSLIGGVYRVNAACSGSFGSHTWTWTVPAAVSVPVQALINVTATQFATIAIGTVTALSRGAMPTVVNSGTATAAILDFGIPVGPPVFAITWGTTAFTWGTTNFVWGS